MHIILCSYCLPSLNQQVCVYTNSPSKSKSPVLGILFHPKLSVLLHRTYSMACIQMHRNKSTEIALNSRCHYCVQYIRMVDLISTALQQIGKYRPIPF